MKLQTKLTIATALAVACSALLARSPQRIKWQYDAVRENNRLARQESEAADAFAKTNTNPLMMKMVTKHEYKLRVTTNDVELGYRDDGVVVWRTPPEAR